MPGISSSSSTNFIVTQVLNKTLGPLCVTYYTIVNATVADSLCCRMISPEQFRLQCILDIYVLIL